MSTMDDDDDVTMVGDEQWLADLREQRLAKSSETPALAAEHASDDDVTMVGDEQWLADLREQRVAASSKPTAVSAEHASDDDVTIAGDDQQLAELHGGMAEEVQETSATEPSVTDELSYDDLDDDITIIEDPKDVNDAKTPSSTTVGLAAPPPPPPDMAAPVAELRDRLQVAPPPTDVGGAGWQPPSRLQAAPTNESASAQLGLGQQNRQSHLSPLVIALAVVVIALAVILAAILFGGSDGAEDLDEQPGTQTTLPTEVTE